MRLFNEFGAEYFGDQLARFPMYKHEALFCDSRGDISEEALYDLRLDEENWKSRVYTDPRERWLFSED